MHPLSETNRISHIYRVFLIKGFLHNIILIILTAGAVELLSLGTGGQVGSDARGAARGDLLAVGGGRSRCARSAGHPLALALRRSAHNEGVPAAPQLDGRQVALGPVHRVVVPRREQQGRTIPVQLGPQLGGQGVEEVAVLLRGQRRMVQRMWRMWVAMAMSVGVGMGMGMGLLLLLLAMRRGAGAPAASPG